MKRILIVISVFFVVFQFISCEGCSRSGRNSLRNSREDNHLNSKPTRTGKTLVKMVEENGIYKIPIEINGSKMNFIFDTGASIISISATEARFLYKQGTLKEQDFIGKINFQDATGTISEGTVIKLHTVKIGNKVLNDIEASIVNNNTAPLLFGQSALSKFGKVSIDYDRNEITFE